jgi:SAM-dependent methyltransferase
MALFGTNSGDAYPDWVAYEPDLVALPDRMGLEGITTLEEWFRWAEEWSMLLRVYGRMGLRDSVFEIGCGQGRVAFALRYLLKDGWYCGFDISASAIKRLTDGFHRRHPNFRFLYEDVHNTHYNPQGRIRPVDLRFPAETGSMDLVYAASIFTHMLPENTAHYFREAARILRPGGRCVFSFFLLDFYHPGQARPFVFARPDFNFDHPYGGFGRDFAIADVENPERMTAFSTDLVRRMAADAGLSLVTDPVPGLWSGTHDAPVGAQDVVVLQRG